MGRSLYPTVKLRLQSAKRKRASLTDEALKTLPRLSRRELRRLERAVQFEQDCRLVGFTGAKRAQANRQPVGEWVQESTRYSAGVSIPAEAPMPSPRLLAYLCQHAVTFESESRMSASDARERMPRQHLTVASGRDPLGNVARHCGEPLPDSDLWNKLNVPKSTDKTDKFWEDTYMAHK